MINQWIWGFSPIFLGIIPILLKTMHPCKSWSWVDHRKVSHLYFGHWRPEFRWNIFPFLCFIPHQVLGKIPLFAWWPPYGWNPSVFLIQFCCFNPQESFGRFFVTRTLPWDPLLLAQITSFVKLWGTKISNMAGFVILASDMKYPRIQSIPARFWGIFQYFIWLGDEIPLRKMPNMANTYSPNYNSYGKLPIDWWFTKKGDIHSYVSLPEATRLPIVDPNATR